MGGSNFFTAPYQLAAQMGVYFEDDDYMYVRFDRLISIEEGLSYLFYWGKRYYAPNPYTKSITKSSRPVVMNNFLVNWAIEKGEKALFSEALKNMFVDEIGNTDILINMLNNFSEVVIEDDKVLLKDVTKIDKYSSDEVYLKFDVNDKKSFFDFFKEGFINNINGCSFEQQQIFYGAPGTGKSHKTKEVTVQYKDTIRTTFHPDSDYSTFVGAYKPTTEKEYMYGLNGGKTVLFKDPSTDEPLQTSKIEYKFVKQAFLKAYIRAWLKMSKICSNITSGALVVSSGKVTYTIADVEPDRVVCQKEEGGFPKKLVKIVWDALWSTGKFVMPTGAQSGQSIQQAISQWIYDLYEVKDVKNFDKGWDEIITRLQKGNAIEVKKDVNGAQTYTLSDNGDKDTVKVTSLAGSSKEQIQKCYEGDKSRSTIKEIAKILKEYNLPTFEEAWKKFTDEVKNKETTTTILVDYEVEPQFLVIEEINRGNCAQIFGDIFQLLDRKEGYSEYPIEADDDIRKALIEDDPNGLSFGDKGLQLSRDIKDQINKVCGDDTVADKVCNGEVLVLPPNLYIWATMNTSDQSLFPIDSAFKRRWEWEYMPIKYKNIDWVIDINGNKYSWVSFQRKVNAKILDATNSEDKMLGDYFVNPHDGIITEKMLLNKILFYLWNDVCKDGEGDIFKISETETVTFSELHGEGGSEKLILMMNELKVDAI